MSTRFYRFKEANLNNDEDFKGSDKSIDISKVFRIDHHITYKSIYYELGNAGNYAYINVDISDKELEIIFPHQTLYYTCADCQNELCICDGDDLRKDEP
jgi:hypothetical protein